MLFQIPQHSDVSQAERSSSAQSDPNDSSLRPGILRLKRNETQGTSMWQ